MLVDLALDVILNYFEEVVQFEEIDNSAEVAELENEISVGNWKGFKAGRRNVSMGLEFGVGAGYVGLERFEAVGSWTREREGLIEDMLGKEKAVCN